MKLLTDLPLPKPMAVAPRTGAWIETFCSLLNIRGPYRRPPHGGVD